LYQKVRYVVSLPYALAGNIHTEFRLSGTEEIWVAEQIPESIRTFLQRAGMKIVQ
jgi:hypothetical protein